MADLPETGTFKIQTVGPMKSGTSKKGNPYKTFDLQLEGDPGWYNTFWTPKEDPQVGMELKGTKSYDEKFNSYKFEIDRAGGKPNWNPAAAQATVVVAASQVVAGFLAVPEHQKLWASTVPEDGEKCKKLFDKYMTTVDVVAKRVREMVVGMPGMAPEQKTAEQPPRVNDGDPGPEAPPPGVENWTDGEEEVNV